MGKLGCLVPQLLDRRAWCGVCSLPLWPISFQLPAFRENNREFCVFWLSSGRLPGQDGAMPRNSHKFLTPLTGNLAEKLRPETGIGRKAPMAQFGQMWSFVNGYSTRS
jgi:hypothetical protein